MRLSGFVKLLLLWLTLSVGGADRAAAQEVRPADSESGRLLRNSDTEPGAVTPALPQPRISGELLWRQPSGALILLQDLLGDSDQTVLDDLWRRVQQQISVPSFELARMDLSGTVAHDVVTLTAELQIRILREREWVAVPLAFDELHLKSVRHSGADGAQAIPEQAESGVKRWVLFGAGVHTIHLELAGKTRPQVPEGRSLHLNLPKATISHANIRFAAPVVVQKLPADAVATMTPESGPAESLEFWGLPETFVLAWNDVVPQVTRKASIEVQSRLTLDLTTIPASLTGAQVMQISGSPITEFQILFPRGFRLQELKATNQAGVSLQSSFDTQPAASNSTATVRLIRPVEGVLNVSFVLDLTDRGFPQDLDVRLPAVLHESVQQSGDLDVLIPQGLLVEERHRAGALRKRVSSPETDTTIAETAYRLRSADSMITLHVEEYEAQFSVSPEMIFQADSRNIVLTARYSVSVLRGAVSELAFFWADYEQSGWRILPGSTVLVSDKGTVPLSLAAGDDSFDVTFKDRQTGQFRVEFRAFAPLPAQPAEQSALICPEVRTGTAEPLVITTIETDEFSLQPVRADTGQLLAAAPTETRADPDRLPADRSVRMWIHDPATAPIRFQLDPQLPSVIATMTVGLQPRDSGIEVHQEISFLIERRDLSELSLVIPAGVRPGIRLADEPGSLPVPEESEIWNFRLLPARRGSLTVIVDYLWPVPNRSEDVRQMELPLVHPPALASRVTRCEVGCASTSGLLVPDDSDWSPVFSERFEAAWTTTGAEISVPLRWQRSQIAGELDVPIFIMSRTNLAATHSVTDTAAYFARIPRTCVFELPPRTAPTRVRINGESLSDSAELYRSISADGNRWTLAIGRSQAVAEGEPSVIEIQTREVLPPEGFLVPSAVISRPVFQGGEFAIPTVWLVESWDGCRIVSTSERYVGGVAGLSAAFSRRASVVLPEARIESIVAPYPPDVQRQIREQLESWNSADPPVDVFCAMSDSGPFQVLLVSPVVLLLATAVSCLVFFLLFLIFRHLSLITPALMLAAALPVAIVVFRDWTVLLLPYVAAGLLFAAGSIAFERRGRALPTQLPGGGPGGDLLTVFGFSRIPTGSTAKQGPDPAMDINPGHSGSPARSLSGT